MNTFRKTVIILLHALVGWGVCSAIIFIGSYAALASPHSGRSRTSTCSFQTPAIAV